MLKGGGYVWYFIQKIPKPLLVKVVKNMFGVSSKNTWCVLCRYVWCFIQKIPGGYDKSFVGFPLKINWWTYRVVDHGLMLFLKSIWCCHIDNSTMFLLLFLKKYTGTPGASLVSKRDSLHKNMGV